MSLVSTLALLVTAAIRPRSDDVRATQLEAELAAAHCELAAQRMLSRHWLGEAQRVIGEKRELERERDMWRERALHAIPQPAGPDFRPPERGQAQLQWAQAQAQQQWAHANAVGLQQLGGFAQDNAQLAQQHQLAMMQNPYNAQTFGQMLGAQALDPGIGIWCNCVPSRAQVWAAQPDGDA